MTRFYKKSSFFCTFIPAWKSEKNECLIVQRKNFPFGVLYESSGYPCNTWDKWFFINRVIQGFVLSCCLQGTKIYALSPRSLISSLRDLAPSGTYTKLNSHFNISPFCVLHRKGNWLVLDCHVLHGENWIQTTSSKWIQLTVI